MSIYKIMAGDIIWSKMAGREKFKRLFFLVEESKRSYKIMTNII